MNSNSLPPGHSISVSPTDSEPRQRRVLFSLILCSLALTCGGGTFAYLASLKQPPSSRQLAEKIYNVEVFDVQPCDLREIVSAFGTARADREVVVDAQVSGEVLSVHPRLEVGETFRAAETQVGESGQSQRLLGDLLVSIDPAIFAQRLAQVQNRIDEANTDLKRLQQEIANNARLLQKVAQDYDIFKEEYDRVKSLVDKGIKTPSDLAQSELELRKYQDFMIQHENEKALFPSRREQIQTRLRVLDTELKLARIDLIHAEIRPPFSGTLSQVMVEQGQFVQQGEPLFKLIDNSRVEIPVPLTLSDYSKIAPRVLSDQRPSVALAENETDEPRWNGYVVRVAPEADETTRTVKVFVMVDNRQQSLPLLPGTFVHARIDGPIWKQVVAVPRDALVTGKLFVAVGKRAKSTSATVLRTLQSLAIVKCELQSNDRVILTNLDVLHQDAQIHVQSHRTLQDELEDQRTQLARRLTLAESENAEAVDSVNH